MRRASRRTIRAGRTPRWRRAATRPRYRRCIPCSFLSKRAHGALRSESAASEIRDELWRRRVEADDDEHPGVGRLRDRTRPRPPRPATPSDSRPAGPRTRTDDLGNRRASRLHHGSLERTTRIERASPGWRPGALPAELRPRVRSAGSRPAELAVARHPREEGWPAGFEPAPAGVTAPGASVYTTATTE